MVYLDKVKRRYQELISIPDASQTVEQSRLIGQYIRLIKVLESKDDN